MIMTEDVKYEKRECESVLKEFCWGTVHYYSWDELMPTEVGAFGRLFICENDVLRFFNFIVADIARKVKIPYDEVRTVIWEENRVFSSYVSKIFKNNKIYKHDSPQIINLKKLLVVPKVDVKLDDVIRMYNSLSLEDKAEFKKRTE